MLTTSKYRLIAFDMDGTLIVEKSSWGTLHNHYGTTSTAKEAVELYLQGLIDYKEFMKRDIGAWPKPLHASEVSKILSNYTLREGAKEVVEEAEKRGMKVAIISAGISLLAGMVADDLGIEYVYANELGVDGEGFLTGDGRMRVDPMFKHLALAELVEKLGISLKDCVAVDDSIHDVKFLQLAGIGLYFGDEKVAKGAGVKAIRSLREILEHL